MGSAQALFRTLSRAGRTEVRIGVVIVTTLAVLAALIFAVIFGFRQSAVMVDDMDRAAERHLVTHYIERYANQSVAQQKVQLTWDDAARNAGVGVSPQWADTYLGEFLFNTFGYQRLYLVSPKGELLLAWHDGHRAPGVEYATMAPEIRQHLREMGRNDSVIGRPVEYRKLADTAWPFDTRGRALTRWSAFREKSGGRPSLVTIQSILPDTDMSLMRATPNHLVAVREIDGSFLSDMGEALLLDDMAMSRLPEQAAGRNALELKEWDGENFGWISWISSPRSAMIQQRVEPLFITFLLFVAALLLGGTHIVRALSQAMVRLRAREAQARHDALYDAMTGLPNRARFTRKLNRALETADLSDEGDDLVIVAFLDIDHFKYINDTLGHSSGDELVRQVGQRLSEGLPGDFVARLGGDEFLVMRRARRHSDAAVDLGPQLMALFRRPFQLLGNDVEATASCGIAWSPQHGSGAEELLRHADIALYRAKQRGRARWRSFTPDMQFALQRHQYLKTALRKALDEDQLSMAYQPIVETGTGKLSGFEALLRWTHPQHGRIGPDVFVPVAEQSGMMNELGDWVLRRVMADMADWPGQDMSINLSPLQLMSRGFVGELAEIVAETGADPARIVLEVTESILIERADRAFDVLGELKAMGFRIALDDFGTGYSSLGYLRSFAFDRIKIDRSFVQNVENDFDGQAILKATAALGRALGMKVVAEGVETPLQRQLVLAAGCHYAQGFLFYQPLERDDVEVLLGDNATVPAERRKRA